MKKYIIEYLENGNKYNRETFVSFDEAVRFYNRIRRREWARMTSN